MRRTLTIPPMLVLAFTLAACGGGDGGTGGDTTGGAAGDSTIALEASDFAFDPDRVSAAAGTIEFELTNVGAAEHDLVIEEADDAHVAHTEAGETATGSIELEAGTYTYYCSVPGHRASGMEGTLEVS